MPLLTFDVTAHLLDMRLAHGKCAIAALPLKLFELRTFGLDPFRGAALHFIDNLGNRMVFGEREEHMNMVCHATYNQRRTNHVCAEYLQDIYEFLRECSGWKEKDSDLWLRI